SDTVFKGRRPAGVTNREQLAVETIPHVDVTGSRWARFPRALQMHFYGIARNPAFGIIVLIAGVICFLALVFGGTRFSGNETFRVFPVTYALIELIRPILQFFVIVIVIYFSVFLVWKDLL